MSDKPTLELLVPQYSEDEETIALLLRSVAIQQGVDMSRVSVSIYGDGGYRLDGDFLSSFPFDVRYAYVEENHGVAHSRNELLDMARGDYVMMCDADDCFWHAGALAFVFLQMSRPDGFDLLNPRFIRTRMEPHGIEFDECMPDYVHVHGKVFDREWLLSTEMRFDESMRTQEDAMFMPVVVELAEQRPGRTLMGEKAYYLWRYRENSLSRTEHFKYATIPDVMEIVVKVAGELEVRGLVKSAAKHWVYTLTDVWAQLTSDEAKGVPQEIIDSALEATVGAAGKMRNIGCLLSDKEWRDAISQAERLNLGSRPPFRSWVGDLVPDVDCGLPDTV